MLGQVPGYMLLLLFSVTDISLGFHKWQGKSKSSLFSSNIDFDTSSEGIFQH